MVLKYGSLITSGHTAGQGLPHIRLNNTKKGGFYHYKLYIKTKLLNQLVVKDRKALIQCIKSLNTLVFTI